MDAASKERNKVVPAVFLLLKKDDMVLLQRRYNTGFQDGKYTFISGHVEAKESPIMAVCREAKEEAGIVIEEENIKFEQILYRKAFDLTENNFNENRPERVDLFFSTEIWEGEPTNTEPDKCDDLRWFPISSLPENIFYIVKHFLEQYPFPPPYEENGY